MLNNVIISMRATQVTVNAEPDEIEFETDGFFTIEDGVACLTYLETELTGMQGTRTSVFIMDDSVIVDREGTVTSRMIYKIGETNDMAYQTPYGQAIMGIRTRSIDKEINENGGHVEIDYVLNFNHSYVSRNKFTITIKPNGGI